MSKAKEIKKTMRELFGQGANGDYVFSGKILSVEESTVSIEVGGMKLTDVKMFSNSEGGNLRLRPKTGSLATVIDMSGGQLRSLYLLRSDDIDKLSYQNGNIAIEIDTETGLVEISSGGVSLKSLFDGLANILKNMKVNVIAPSSPSGTPTPDVVALIEKHQANVETLLR